MIKIIKLKNTGLAPGERAGTWQHVAAMWGVQINGQLAARIFTVMGNSMVIDAESGRCLFQTALLPMKHRQNRVVIAKDWAINYFNKINA